MTRTQVLVNAGVLTLAGGLMISTASAAAADADDVQATTLGSSAQLINGNVVQRWTVSGLQPSSDAIPHPVAGTLWEAKASDEAVQGTVIPIVSNFNARTPDGHEYRVLFGAATPQGVNPATLAQGQTTAGKLYFDVTGPAPDSVVFNAAGQDLAVWRPAPPAPPRSSNSGTRTVPPAATTPQTVPAPAISSTPTTAPAAMGATPATPEAGSAGTPLTAPGAVTPAPEASATPAPEAGSAGTPLPAGSAGTPVNTPAATSGPASGPAPASVTSTPPTAPAPAAGSAGSPVAPTGPAAAPATTTAAPPTP